MLKYLNKTIIQELFSILDKEEAAYPEADEDGSVTYNLASVVDDSRFQESLELDFQLFEYYQSLSQEERNEIAALYWFARNDFSTFDQAYQYAAGNVPNSAYLKSKGFYLKHKLLETGLIPTDWIK